MTERRECCICGTTLRTIRVEMFRYLVYEPGGEYDAGPRCLDRERCRALVEAMDKVWNVDDGPAALPRITARKTEHPAATAQPAAPDPGPEPAEHRELASVRGEQMGAW